jgi:hypothetical protein
MELNSWMSNFYGEKWYTLTKNPGSVLYYPGLYEWKIDSQNTKDYFYAQNNGFELVETQVGFKTLIKEWGDTTYTRIASIQDLDAILKITQICFLNNPNFISRFTNPNYFASHHLEKYYNLSITNYFNNPNCITSVSEINNKIVGYYMIIKENDSEYRGIMTGVLPEGRGKGLHIKMQNKCFENIGKPFYTLNKTQLTNLNTLNNHIKEKRVLTDITHIFYKKVD